MKESLQILRADLKNMPKNPLKEYELELIAE